MLGNASPHTKSSVVNREDICLQTLLLLFKCANYRNKRPFVSTTTEALVGTLMTIGDVQPVRFAAWQNSDKKFQKSFASLRNGRDFTLYDGDVNEHVTSKYKDFFSLVVEREPGFATYSVGEVS